MEKQDVKRIAEAFTALEKAQTELNEKVAEFKNVLRNTKIDLKVYDCVAFIMTTRNKEANNNGSQAGYANGYVAVPPEHPYFGKSYDDTEIEVHGGITFAEYSDEIKKHWDKYLSDIEMLDGATEIPSGWYIFGFDTLHYRDSLETCPKEYCVAETLNLKEQLDCAFI